MTDQPTVPVEAKPVVASKTSWLAWLTFLSGALLAVQQSGLVLPPKVMGGIVMAYGIILQILRVVTTQPVTLSLTPQVGEAPAPPWTGSTGSPVRVTGGGRGGSDGHP